MKTLQSELVKYRHFVSNMRNLHYVKQGDKIMQQEHSPSRNTGGRASNTRYKRSPEELLADIDKVDQLVASGRFNQIEALHEVGLQSSVYHYKKRQQRLEPAKSDKPRKFAHRNRQSNAQTFQERKQKVLSEMEKPSVPQIRDDKELRELKERFQELANKYDQLKEYVVNHCILDQKH